MHKYGHYICLNSSIRARMRRETKGIPSAKLLTGSSAKLLAAPLTLNYGCAMGNCIKSKTKNEPFSFLNPLLLSLTVMVMLVKWETLQAHFKSYSTKAS